MRALVVDAATTVRIYHREILTSAGFVVEEAMNGLEGLERAMGSAEPPNRFVGDVNMPQMCGYSFPRAIRAEPTLCAVPAIMISTESEAGDADRAFAAGANLFLVRPVRPEVLAAFERSLAGAEEGAGQ